MNRRTGHTNRIGLTLFGLVSIAIGGTGLARALNLSPGLLGAGRDPILDDGTRRFATDHWWFWPALAVIAALVALLALTWLAVQVRPHLRYLGLEPESRHGITQLTARTVAHAVEDDLVGGSQIQRAHAMFTGASINPRLILTVRFRVGTDPTDARVRIQHAVTRLRNALETDRFTTTIQIR